MAARHRVQDVQGLLSDKYCFGSHAPHESIILGRFPSHRIKKNIAYMKKNHSERFRIAKGNRTEKKCAKTLVKNEMRVVSAS